ncbi:MAG: flagellar hook-associated protein FlgK [Gammaproteobacteria bacterium]|nr:MAG: flagellar hook-associated protein FlgK [Gammaproteobacteria bacterium]
MSSIVNIGLTGLLTHQAALNTTSHNVSNTDTPGYSRREVEFVQKSPQFVGYGYEGSGVQAQTVKRIAEEFLVGQVRADEVVYNRSNAFLTQVEQLDGLLSRDATSLSSAMSGFFGALQGGADDPTAIPERQIVLSESENLVSRFHSLHTRLEDQSTATIEQITAAVSEVNSLARSLGYLNQAISRAMPLAQGDLPNSLLDERDELLRKLAEKTSLEAIVKPDHTVDVFIGKGTALVVDAAVSEVSVLEDPLDPSQIEIALTQNGLQRQITEDIVGGELGGVLQFRDSLLTEAFSTMGRIALVLADTVNRQHRLGMDLENNPGDFFFADINRIDLQRSRVLGSDNNALPHDRVVSLEIRDVDQLAIDEYTLSFEGPADSDYTLRNNTTNTVVKQGSLPDGFPVSIDFDGLRLRLESGSFQMGDQFLVQPTKHAARDISLHIDRVEEVAFAALIRTGADLGNRGSAVISPGTMLDVDSPLTRQTLSPFGTPGELSPPIAVRFLTDDIYEVMDASDPANLQPLNPPLNSQQYISGVANSLFTADPAETVVSAGGTNIGQMPVPGPRPGADWQSFDNGYSGQTITVLTRDPDTGVATPSSVTINPDASASAIANTLSGIAGVQVNAYSEIKIRQFVDDGDANPLELSLNGQILTITPPAVLGPDALADAINANAVLRDQSIYAVSDGVELSVFASSGVDLVVEVGGAGDSVTVDKISPYDNSVLASRSVVSGQGVAVAGFLDVTLSKGATLFSATNGVFQQTPPARSAYLGFTAEISGVPQAGDVFRIGYNEAGVSDNRNALGLVALELAETFAGVSTYTDVYSSMVEKIGTETSRSRLNTEASESLLKQSISNRDSVSGVNLDEEAARLVQYEAAYNASSKVVTLAQELMDTLLGTFR